MICPRCSTELKATEFAGVRIETCPDCGGSWFDRDELRQARNIVDPDLAWVELNLWKETDGFHVRKDSCECPSCGGKMALIGYSDTEVELDYCRECGGVWLDQGEFNAIINALEEDIDSTSASEFLKISIKEMQELIEATDNFGKEWKHFRTVLKLLEYRVLAEHRTIAGIIENFRSPFA